MWQPMQTFPRTETIPTPCLFFIIRSNLNIASLVKSGESFSSSFFRSSSWACLWAISESSLTLFSLISSSLLAISASSCLIDASRILNSPSSFCTSFLMDSALTPASSISFCRISYSRCVSIVSIDFSAFSRFCSASKRSAFKTAMFLRNSS